MLATYKSLRGGRGSELVTRRYEYLISLNGEFFVLTQKMGLLIAMKNSSFISRK